jgi:uncharacterized protein (TIGR02285 family)
MAWWQGILTGQLWARACACAVVPLAMLCSARAQDTIHWGWQDTAPDQITEGPDRDKGRQDRIRTFLQQRLTSYKHQQDIAPLARILEEIKAGRPWCYVNAVRKPEREEWAVFSLPVIINLPYKIVIRAEDKRKFSEKRGGQLSLEALLRNPRLQGSMTRGRSYGTAIDDIIKRVPPANYHVNDIGALRMLQARRIDYIVAYPVRVMYAARQTGRVDGLATLPFQEGGDAIVTHVMCPKNDWGRQVIADVDTVLRKERPNPAYRRLMEAWHDKESVREIRRLYDSVFLTAN